MRHVIGVDLGGTKISASLVDSNGSVLLTRQVKTPSRSGGAAVLDATIELIGHLQEQTMLQRLAVSGIGIGSAGVIEKKGDKPKYEVPRNEIPTTIRRSHFSADEATTTTLHGVNKSTTAG